MQLLRTFCHEIEKQCMKRKEMQREEKNKKIRKLKDKNSCIRHVTRKHLFLRSSNFTGPCFHCHNTEKAETCNVNWQLTF